jgi:hypothetical protein
MTSEERLYNRLVVVPDPAESACIHMPDGGICGPCQRLKALDIIGDELDAVRREALEAADRVCDSHAEHLRGTALTYDRDDPGCHCSPRSHLLQAARAARECAQAIRALQDKPKEAECAKK